MWGAATSAHQVEGGNHNDWTEWELNNAERLSREAERRFGHLPHWAEIQKDAENPANYISGRACDHYNRFREDFDIAKSLGHNAHRFSIEWSRIEPGEGKFDEKEIEHYREVIRALRERSMEPFVTLWHWTIPTWLRDKGGVMAFDFPRLFSRYAAYVVDQFPEVKFWMTLNEPTSAIVNSYFLGIWPPQKRGILKTLRAYWNLAMAHSCAYKEIKKVNKSAQVGFGNILSYCEPYSKNLLDIIATKFVDFWSNILFLRLTGNAHDYLTLQYYFHYKIKFPGIRNENKKVSDMGWELYPDGIYHLLKRLSKYKKPIYITEHGLADTKDLYRAWYISESLKRIARAIKEGIDIRGYFHWSLLDNFEWDKGFWPRFGLVEIDYKTLERKIRPSALEY